MKRTAVRLILAGVLAAGAFAALRSLPALTHLEGHLRDWRAGLGPWGLVLLAALFTPVCMCLIPATVLLLLAGYFYDVVPAVVAASLGTTVAAGVIFQVGRTLARGWVERRFGHHPRFRAFDQAVAENGFRVVLLTRLSPLFPFIFLNYAYSLTRVSFRAYLLGTWLGMLPNLVLWVYLGSTVQDLGQLLQGRFRGQQASPVQLWHTLLTIVGLLATLAVTVIITRMARQALKQVLPGVEPEPQPVPLVARADEELLETTCR
jgi:uncharacterized membrane protein YdjX (TVP38/TMEM64 family)